MSNQMHDILRHSIPWAKGCHNCTKFVNGQCAVLTEPPDECWAWSDDPEWEKKAEEATKRYEEMK